MRWPCPVLWLVPTSSLAPIAWPASIPQLAPMVPRGDRECPIGVACADILSPPLGLQRSRGLASFVPCSDCVAHLGPMTWPEGLPFLLGELVLTASHGGRGVTQNVAAIRLTTLAGDSVSPASMLVAELISEVRSRQGRTWYDPHSNLRVQLLGTWWRWHRCSSQSTLCDIDFGNGAPSPLDFGPVLLTLPLRVTYSFRAPDALKLQGRLWGLKHRSNRWFHSEAAFPLKRHSHLAIILEHPVDHPPPSPPCSADPSATEAWKWRSQTAASRRGISSNSMPFGEKVSMARSEGSGSPIPALSGLGLFRGRIIERAKACDAGVVDSVVQLVGELKNICVVAELNFRVDHPMSSAVASCTRLGKAGSELGLDHRCPRRPLCCAQHMSCGDIVGCGGSMGCRDPMGSAETSRSSRLEYTA